MNQSSKRPLVFICSPMAGDIKRNLENARLYCRFAMEKGVLPYCPHLFYSNFMDDENERERKLGMSFALEMLEKCDGLWAFGGRITKGMRGEINKAAARGMMIKYYNMKCVEVSPFE